MRMPSKRYNKTGNKIFKTLLSIMFALIISLALTILFVLYTPTIFNYTLNTGLDLLPKAKFVEYKVQSKNELANEWLEESDGLLADNDLFDKLKAKLPSSDKKNTFFANMFVVHDYPSYCFFTVFGKHKTMDLTWTVKGIRCKGEKQCKDPHFINNCPPRHKKQK